MLTQVPVPSTDGIDFHYAKIHKSTENTSSIPRVELPTFLFIVRFTIYTLIFIYIILSLNTDGLDARYRPHLLLLIELLLVTCQAR